MADATDNRKDSGTSTQSFEGPERFTLPMKASTEIFQGTLVGVDTTDLTNLPAVPMGATATKQVRGVAASHVNNSTGAVGDTSIEVTSWSTMMENATSGDACTKAHLFGPVYSVDNQTVANNSANGTRPCAGVLVDFDKATGKPVVLPNPIVAGIFAKTLGLNAIGGVQLSATSMRLLAFAGHNGAGACTSTGTKVGDTVVGVIDLAAGSVSAAASFESTITVANQIQQTDASNLSTLKYALLVVAKS